MTQQEYNQLSQQMSKMGHTIKLNNGKITDSTGKPLLKDKQSGKYYVHDKIGNRLYFTDNGKFIKNAQNQKKGFFDKVEDGLKTLASEMNKANPEGYKSFISPGSQYIVQLSQAANEIPVKTSDGSFRTYSEDEQKKAKKQLSILGGSAVAAPFVAQTAITSTPYILSGMKTVGQTLTPSTWINGIGQSLGYNFDKAGLVADLLASGYFAKKAGDEIDENGLNLKTGFNALLSLAPITRDQKAVNAVSNTIRNPMYTVRSMFDDINTVRNTFSSPTTRLAREFNQSIKNTNLSSKVPFNFSHMRDIRFPKLSDAFTQKYYRNGNYKNHAMLTYLQSLDKKDRKFVIEQIQRGSKYPVLPEEAQSSDLLYRISQMTGKEQDAFFTSNVNNSIELMHQRGLTGGYDRLRTIQDNALKEIGKTNPELESAIRHYIDAKVNPEYFTDNRFDLSKYFSSIPSDSEANILNDYLYQADQNLQARIASNLTPGGIWHSYNAPINMIPNEKGAGANASFNMLFQGENMKLFDPKVKAHEIHHLLSYPTIYPPNQMIKYPKVSYFSIGDDLSNMREFDKNIALIDYLYNQGYGTEAVDRLSQIYNWFGINNGKELYKINPSEFNFASRYYTKTPYPNTNNNMSDLFMTIKDPKKFLEWASPYALMTFPLLTSNNEQNE